MNTSTPCGFYRLKAHNKMGDTVSPDDCWSHDGVSWIPTAIGPVMLTPDLMKRTGPFIRRKKNTFRNISPNDRKNQR